MIGLGTIINVVAIIAGGLLGKLLGRVCVYTDKVLGGRYVKFNYGYTEYNEG